jgi:hypothetical protein
MKTIDLLHRVGAALYGERWQSGLARDLGVAVRTVQRWAVGDNPIPPGVWSDLDRLLAARTDAITELRRLLAEDRVQRPLSSSNKMG